MTAALPLRPYTPLRMVLTVCGHCFSEDPDREIDYETDILQGNTQPKQNPIWSAALEIRNGPHREHRPAEAAPQRHHLPRLRDGRDAARLHLPARTR